MLNRRVLVLFTSDGLLNIVMTTCWGAFCVLLGNVRGMRWRMCILTVRRSVVRVVRRLRSITMGVICAWVC